MAEPAGEKSANNASRKNGRRLAEKVAGAEEAEKLPLRELSLDTEQPKITLHQAGLRYTWHSLCVNI